MTTCPRGLCDGSGTRVVCSEPMAGLAGFETESCPCGGPPGSTCPQCGGSGRYQPLGSQEYERCCLCAGLGRIAPADIAKPLGEEMVCAYCHGTPPKPDARGLVQPCLCTLSGHDGPKVSRLEAAWATAAADYRAWSSAYEALKSAEKNERQFLRQAQRSERDAVAIGPRPEKAPT